MEGFLTRGFHSDTSIGTHELYKLATVEPAIENCMNSRLFDAPKRIHVDSSQCSSLSRLFCAKKSKNTGRRVTEKRRRKLVTVNYMN